MRTEAQIEASRLNGAKSGGPGIPSRGDGDVTAAGKLNPSRNAGRNRLVAGSFALLLEDSAELEQSLNELCAEFQPATPFQRSLVVSLAAAMRTLADNTRVLHMLDRQDARLDHQYQRTARLLMEIQSRRPNAPAPAAPGPVVEPEPVDTEVPADEPLAADSESDTPQFIGMLPSEPCVAQSLVVATSALVSTPATQNGSVAANFPAKISTNEPNNPLKTNGSASTPVPGTRAESASAAAALLSNSQPWEIPLTSAAH